MNKCTWLGIWYNIRYFTSFPLRGMIAMGHDLEYTGEIHGDAWVMTCKNCGIHAHSEVGPQAEIEEI